MRNNNLFCSNKAIAGKALTIILCTIAIIVAFIVFYYSITINLEDKVTSLKVAVEDHNNEQKMLSLFTLDIVKELENGRTFKFSEALQDLYGENVQCKLSIDEEKLDVGCEKIKGFSNKVEIEIPRNNLKKSLIVFEVVE